MDEGSIELVHGKPFITNMCGNRLFSFYVNNYYPSIYESYSNLNEKLADLIRKNTSKSDILLEYDTGNGVLGVLESDHCKKFYSISHYKQKSNGIIANLKYNGLPGIYLYTYSYYISCLISKK